LVVDDDMVSRHVLGQALANAKLEHVSVGSGAEALQQIERVHPSLVLLDLVMPPPDGYQILRILRARAETKDLPVVVLTALDAEDEIAKAFEAGADDFVRKPFKPVELVARVRGQLRLRQAMDALARKEKDAHVVLELTQALASNLDFRGILFTVVQRLASRRTSATSSPHPTTSSCATCRSTSRSTPRSSRCSRAVSRSSSKTPRPTR
jgi:DNA-binding response OmpR family regulator